ncbi:hypothetical protein F503_07851 [Ophiostoma piceae UAMH 11346]|uniref:Duf833 domain-containing protein n=1 Tax=Ophiostoma piceae (strain UAMH 11346) TaxID=1262450 RepID=S3D1U4_OPHP1|nr:hypothetical protein F503_07851 [Ophiostoma piceae UAMH 11346]
MCIVLLTTAHPDYALIVIDNRDEFILRPTSRPHWWAGRESHDKDILSSRDLQRPEHGTWLGITKAGHFSVLTNFREVSPNDAAHPIAGQRSRGGMVTAWLTADPTESTEHFVARMLDGQGVKGVGGFSLICGKLRKSCFDTQGQKKKALAVMSNRADELTQVPWIAGQRGEVYGLSNSSYDEPDVWPKVRNGRELLQKLIDKPPAGVDELRAGLFSILDDDTLPQSPGLSFEDQIPLLKNSIFIPAIGDEAHQLSMNKAVAGGPREARADTEPDETPVPSVIQNANGATTEADAELAKEERADQSMGFMTGLYGTQRQTIVLVDWEGRVSFTERALWDANGNPIPKGQGDAHFDFQVEGWNDDDVVSNGVHE